MAAEKLGWIASSLAKLGYKKSFLAEADQSINQYGSETLTTASLLGSGGTSARSRIMIYQKYAEMLTDPIVSGSMRLHVTAALGGHETSGDVVFIEARADAEANTSTSKETDKLVKELQQYLTPIFNRIAQTVSYNAVGYGDAYARLYPVKGRGIVDVYVDEMVLPPLVQPYEQGNKTRVCVIAIGPKMRERLTMNQFARMRLPRMIYTPQPMAVEKAWRMQIVEDDPDKLPIMPALAGGSFLADAEEQFNKFRAALQGLVGQRVLDSIDESIFTAQVQGMTKEQRQEFIASVKQMLTRSKQVADDAVKTGIPFLGRIRHLIPTWNDKQLLAVQSVNSSGGAGAGRSGNISIEDVLFHAKLLSGSLGTDITMLGFADMMSGGLGEGGFFRTSAQTAERSRTIRIALTEFFDSIVEVHCHYKYGKSFEPAKRPWQINFYGSISALESERQKTQLDAMSAGMTLVQTLTMCRDLGMDENATATMLEKVMKFDTAEAKMYARALKNAKPPEPAGFGGGPPGGGFGGEGGDDFGGFGGGAEGDDKSKVKPPAIASAE